jgi:hypothetical protein
MKKKHTAGLALPPDLLARAKRRAAELDCSFSKYVRDLLRADLKKAEREAARKMEGWPSNDPPPKATWRPMPPCKSSMRPNPSGPLIT